MIKIVSSRTLWKLSVELVSTDSFNYILTNSTDNFKFSARVRQPLDVGVIAVSSALCGLFSLWHGTIVSLPGGGSNQ